MEIVAKTTVVLCWLAFAAIIGCAIAGVKI